MAITVGILGQSGDGKSTSIAINPDGKYDLANYAGMNPATTIIFNCDGKRPPFSLKDKWVLNKNYFVTSDSNVVENALKSISNSKTIKAIIIDTINAIMVDKEMLDTKKLSFDKWADLAKDIYSMIHTANGLRDDLIIYFMGHVSLYTDVDGSESKCLITNGRKLEKIRLESKLPIVLFTRVDKGIDGDNTFLFETQKNRSTAKTPLGMFDEFTIPNSLSLVDNKIRAYYGI